MTALTRTGYRGRQLGRASYVEAPPEWRGTTRQVCGLYPLAVGSGSPAIGTPLGRNLLSGRAVCFDPLSWYTRAKLLSNPSAVFLSAPGIGKSTVGRRLCIGAAATGAVPLILGDLRPDYADLVRALGGQVITLGRGAGSLNILDSGGLDDAAALLGGKAAEQLRSEAHGRRLNLLSALLTVVRGRRLADAELTALSAALRALAGRWRRRKTAPVLADLIRLLEDGPEEVRAVTLDRGSDERYRQVVDPLQRSLTALTDGPLGAVFARPTTERLRLDAPAVCLDVSAIAAGDSQLQAAALLACWSVGFGAVEAANSLADAGAGPQRRFLVVLDELWRVLRAGEGLVDRVDELTRLNRRDGVGQLMIFHTVADLSALTHEADRQKARGFVERAGAVLVGGLPRQELQSLQGTVPFTGAEIDMVSSWSTPAGWAAGAEPPGRGKFLLKVGARPGVPFRVELTAAELTSDVHNTARRWTA